MVLAHVVNSLLQHISSFSCHFRGCKAPLSSIVSGAISRLSYIYPLPYNSCPLAKFLHSAKQASVKLAENTWLLEYNSNCVNEKSPSPVT